MAHEAVSIIHATFRLCRYVKENFHIKQTYGVMIFYMACSKFGHCVELSKEMYHKVITEPLFLKVSETFGTIVHSQIIIENMLCLVSNERESDVSDFYGPKIFNFRKFN